MRIIVQSKHLFCHIFDYKHSRHSMTDYTPSISWLQWRKLISMISITINLSSRLIPIKRRSGLDLHKLWINNFISSAPCVLVGSLELVWIPQIKASQSYRQLRSRTVKSQAFGVILTQLRSVSHSHASVLIYHAFAANHALFSSFYH